MAEAIVSTVVAQLADIIRKQIEEEVSLVRGVKKEVLYLSDELKAIRNVLDDAERRGYKEKTIQNWLKKLEDTSYDISDVLDEWNYAILKLRIEGNDNDVVPKPKVCPFIPSSSSCFKKITTYPVIARKIKRLKERLDMIVKEKDRYDFIVTQPIEPRKSDRVKSTSFIDVSEIHGRDIDKDVLVRKLILEVAHQEEVGPRVISIVGTGGIGKTTLAQLVYNNDGVTNCFKKRIWICVSDVFDEIKIAKGIVEQVRRSSPNLNELESLLKCLADSVSGEKFLLVLDDVWEEYCTKWEPLKNSLKCGGPGSKILMTTRSERVARMMGTIEFHHLGLLSDIDCWSLMHRIAFSGRKEGDCEKLQYIGKEIANKCKGLPLAAKVLGSLLQFKDTVDEWKNVLYSEIWQLKEVEVDLFRHLFLSYNELSPTMKRCFSYCAVFPKDFRIGAVKLTRMWMALGYLSSKGSAGHLKIRGKDCFDNLRMRSFFQDFKEDGAGVSCKMHDIVHDFAQFLRKNNSYDMENPDGRVDAKTNMPSQAIDPSLISHVKVYRGLVFQNERPLQHVLKCAPCLRMLSLNDCNLVEIPPTIENLIHLRYLDLSNNPLLAQIPQTVCKLYNLETLYLKSCELKEIPREIGNLIHLTHLDLSFNEDIQELPNTVYNLHDLRTLDLSNCSGLERLPEGIHKLVNLKRLYNINTDKLIQIPQGFEQLTGLLTLMQFHAGRGWSKLGYLNRLDQLSGYIRLRISLNEAEDVIEARKAELRNKIDVDRIELMFDDTMGRTNEEESMRNDVMEALQPPPNLRRMDIHEYKGTKFPGWITSSLNHLRVLLIFRAHYCSALPPLGKLPCLEMLEIISMNNFQLLGREFLGIETTGDTIDASPPSSAAVVGFPKLKSLHISMCYNWNEWEDITAEGEGSANVSIMPCLRELRMFGCGLTVLPHRLLRKASSLERLSIRGSVRLYERYKEGSGWRSLSHIPRVEVLS